MDVVHRFPESARRTADGGTTRALEDLQYIRRCLENAGSFTGVPGLGGMLVGLSALVATAVAMFQQSNDTWVQIWIAEAFVALAIGVIFLVRKARIAGASLARGPGLRFALSLVPSAIAAAVVTIALVRVGAYGVLPGLWLLLYGTAVITGGAFSVRIVSFMGASFMVLGIAALFFPMRDVFMGAGFGGLHVGFGWIIRRRHGG